jgi:hypothetical protein
VTPLWISAQPQDQLCNAHETAVFEAVVESSLPVSYQWQFGGHDLHDDARISGATTARLSMGNIGTLDAGTYTLIASNTAGVVISLGASVSVVSHPPVIACQPQSQSVLAGTNVNLFVCVESVYADYGVQWLSNGIPLAGQTATNLFLTNVVPEESAFYSCTVSNIDGVVVSDQAWVEIQPFVPLIVEGPQSAQVLVDTLTNAGFYTLTLTAQGPDLRYLWYKNGSWVPQNPVNKTLRLYPECGVASDCFVVVTNRYGAATSDVATISFQYLPPRVSTPPASRTVQWGDSCSFAVETYYTPSGLWFQWRHNGREISGATESTLTLNNVTTNDAGYYDVLITNCSGGSVLSRSAQLTVLTDPPRFLVKPEDLELDVGLKRICRAWSRGLCR